MPASRAACWRVSWPSSPRSGLVESEKVAAEGSVEAGKEALLACDAWMRHAVEALRDATCVGPSPPGVVIRSSPEKQAPLILLSVE